jgi:hypothetical protein
MRYDLKRGFLSLTDSMYPPAESGLLSEDAQFILGLRLLIARAANKDSLAWWDDESLAGHSAYLLNRIFPIAPQTAARSLALRAALSRHEAVCASEPNALHLFRLDAANQDELAVHQVALSAISMSEEPVDTMDELRARLTQLIDDRRPYKRVRLTGNQGLLIEIPAPPTGVSVWRHRTQTLAWAYLEGAYGQPVFPFILE